MLKMTVVSLALVVGMGAAPGVSGQQVASQDAMIRYTVDRKSEPAALGIEWLVPVVGHAYAGNARKGILPAVVHVAGLTAFVMGARCDSVCKLNNQGSEDEGLAWAGLGVAAVGKAWGMISAYRTAGNHNADLRRRLNLTLAPRDGGVAAGLSLTF